MAEQQADQTEKRAAAAGGAVSTSKALMVLLAILALEAGAIGLTVYFAGGPAEAKGEAPDAAADAAAEADRPVEVLVIADKFPNMQTGRHFLYDTEVYITVRQRDGAAVERELEARRAQISAAMATIIRKAHPAYFREATLATLTRQTRAMLDEHLGADPEGEPYVEQVLITRCNPFRADF